MSGLCSSGHSITFITVHLKVFNGKKNRGCWQRIYPKVFFYGDFISECSNYYFHFTFLILALVCFVCFFMLFLYVLHTALSARDCRHNCSLYILISTLKSLYWLTYKNKQCILIFKVSCNHTKKIIQISFLLHKLFRFF